MRSVSIGLIVLLVLFVAVSANGGQFMGGKGFLHMNTALVLPPGALNMSLYARGYSFTVPGHNITFSNGTSALAASFGFTRHVELGFTQVLYQDVNAINRVGYKGEEISVMIPGDTHIRFKISGFGIGEKVFWGITPVLRYRVGRYHDIQLEPYESEGIEAELLATFSWYQKPFYPEEALSVHLNVGMINHNDAESPTEASQSLTYLIGAVYPKLVFDFGLELYGSSFVKRPNERILSREDWLYITPFVRYKLFKGFHFTMGLDALLVGDTNTSTGSYGADFPNYSTWRVTGKISFSPSTAFYVSPTFVKVDEAGSGRGRSTGVRSSSGGSFDRQSLFRWAIEEGGADIEAADLDLMKIRQERIKAEEELKRLKRKLEEKKRGK